ncbi:Acyl-CoA dehydrogenase OS=Streptomyces microflavus OX=1919 GN=G3I39_29500 PE=3 SV=1 [Streptomyces microflavus]
MERVLLYRRSVAATGEDPHGHRHGHRGITEEHRALAHSGRGWLARAAPPGEVRKLLEGGPGRPRGAPRPLEVLAGQGLTGIHLPEEYGGGGGGLLDLAVVLEEAAHASLPGPCLATALVGEVVRWWRAPGPVT